MDTLTNALPRPSIRTALQVKLQELSRFKDIIDAEAEAARITIEANANRESVIQAAKSRLEQAEARLQTAIAEADKIVATANERAQEIAGDAFAAMGRAKELTDAAQAMKNII